MGLGVVQLAVLQGPSQAWFVDIKLQGLGLCLQIQCHAMVNHVTCDGCQFDKEDFERSNGPLCRGCVLVLHCYRPMVSPWA